VESILDAQIARLQALAAQDDQDPLSSGADASGRPPAASAPLILIPSYEVTRGQTESACQSPEAPGWAWPTPCVPKTCEKRLGVAFCRETVRKYEQGCCRGDCWGCEDHLRDRTAVKFRKESITPHLAGRALCYTVPTVPEHRRQAAADWATWARWTKLFLKALQKHFGLVWAWVRTDPAGKCDYANKTEEFCLCAKCSKWHPHLNILWVRENGRGKLDDDELWLMKSLWAEIVGADHAWDGDYLRPIVSVHHSFVLDPATLQGEEAKRAEGKLWHLYRYQGRKWPAWQKAAKQYLRIRPFGKFPKKVLTEEAVIKRLRVLYEELEVAKRRGDPKLEAEIFDLERRLAEANRQGLARVAAKLEKKIAAKRRRLPAERIQRRIDRLRTNTACRCGCGVTRYPEPEPVCECCGEKVRCMPVLDQQEADYWIAQGPAAIREEIKRRRRVGDKNGYEPFEGQLVREWSEPEVGLFS